MAESKYGKYIVSKPRDEDIAEWKEVGDTRKTNVYVDSKIVEGGFFAQGTMLYKASDEPYPDKPHKHDWDEYLGFIGTNPDDPLDLGGEVELYLGGEKHVITKTSMVFCPAGLEHCPVYFRRVDSPIWFLATGPEKQYEVEFEDGTKVIK
jgi:hypothetical protein